MGRHVLSIGLLPHLMGDPRMTARPQVQHPGCQAKRGWIVLEARGDQDGLGIQTPQEEVFVCFFGGLSTFSKRGTGCHV